MTPDVEQIRAALAACNGKPWAHYYASPEDRHLVANAPVWLASLCDEIERLRALGCDIPTRVFAERDAALANVKRIGDIAEKALAQLDESGARNVAALAECERLRVELADARSEVEDWKHAAGSSDDTY